MKLLFDENLSHLLIGQLANFYPESTHVRELGLKTASDAEVWEYAAQHDFVIVTKDSDFQQRSLVFGHPPKVVWLRIGNSSTAEIVQLLQDHLPQLLSFQQDFDASFLMIR